MTQQHDAPEGGAVQPVAWRGRDREGCPWNVYRDEADVRRDGWRFIEPLYAPSADPTPPAPSGLVGAETMRPFLNAPLDHDASSTMSQPRGLTSTDAGHAETKNGSEGIFDRWHIEPLIREWLNEAGTKPNIIDGLVNTMRLRLSRADAHRAEPSTACWVQTRPWQDGDSRGFATYEAAARYAEPLGKPIRPLYSGDTGEVVIGWWAHTIGYEHGDNRPFRKPSKAIAFAAEHGGIVRPFTDGGGFSAVSATLDATLSDQQGGAVPAKGLICSRCGNRRYVEWCPYCDSGAVPAGDLREAGFCDNPFADLWSIVHEEDEDLRVRAGKDYAVALRRVLPATFEPPIPGFDEDKLWAQASMVSAYALKGYPRNTFVDVLNDDLLKLDALTHGPFSPRLAEQPAPAGTGDADRVEGLRPGIEKALEIVEAERETVSVSSSAYQRLWSVRNALRDVLDGASGQGEGL